MPKTQKRRRKEAKTDYKARFALLKSEKCRLVIRKTNRYIIAQLVNSNLAQDKVLKTLSSKDLLDKGWPKEKAGSLKSLVAAYLTGFMLVKQYKGKIKEAVFDLGMNRNIPRGRIYAALKGAIDAGLNIQYDKKVLPSEERLKANKNTANLLEKIKGEL